MATVVVSTSKETTMRPLPRALRRARLWTSGLLTAAVVAVGALGVHLADDHAQALAAQTTSGTSSDTSGTTSTTGASGSSDSSGTDDSSSSSGSSDQSGFVAVAPLSNSGGQAQSGSGGS